MQSALSGKKASGLATDLLREDHGKVRELFAQYREAAAERSDTRQSLAEEVCMQLEVHAQVEEEIFYPAIRGIQPSFATHAHEAHHAVAEQINRLKESTSDDSEYDRTMDLIMELCEPDFSEEERVFAILEERVPQALGLMRAKMVQRKEQLTGSTREMEGRS